jgi:hypothetical protein
MLLRYLVHQTYRARPQIEIQGYRMLKYGSINHLFFDDQKLLSAHRWELYFYPKHLKSTHISLLESQQFF